MRNIKTYFIYLLIFYIHIINIYSYVNEKFLSNDDDLNKISHENLIESIHKRDRRATGNDTTIIYDGSGNMTIELTTNNLFIQITSESISSTINTTNSPITNATVSTIYVVTNSSTTTTTSIVPSQHCNSSIEVQLPNGTCASKSDAQIYAVNLLRNRTSNATIIAYSLSLYVTSIATSNLSSNPNYILSANEIEECVTSLDNVHLTINSNTSFIMAQQTNQGGNITTLGASYMRGIGGQIINNFNIDNVINSSISAAAIINNRSFIDITSFNMLIIDKPNTYESIDNSTNKILASSVIVTSIRRNSSVLLPMNISLYFQILNEYRPTINVRYSCSYYNLNNSRWNDSGCTQPLFNQQFNRYECSCNHLSTFALLYSPYLMSCNTSTEVLLSNGTCISKNDAQISAVNLLRNNSSNSTIIANALSLYISSITNSNTTLNSTYTLTLDEIDTYLSDISNINITVNTIDSILIAQQPNQGGNIIVLGASFTRNIGGEVVNSSNKDNVISTPLSAAAIISNESLSDVTSLNMLIIDKPTSYENIDNSTNKTLASSIIVASVQRNSPTNFPMNVSLYFQVLEEYKPNVSARYLCSFYDTNNFIWNESGCTTPLFNQQFNRYECSCDHLTSFALIWLPQSLLTNSTQTLDAQDIASLVFQSISIICFIIIITDAIIRRIRSSIVSLSAYELLPLISGASTTILFIFYIALGMTVYTQTSSQTQTECFLSSSILMFFVYFFLIFMFCTKTSIGYFNYLRFVRLFPEPSLRKLFIMILISFFISITCVALAIGFNSNSSFSIIQLYPYKLCWFSRNVIYYFLTIPACLFLVINIIVYILVGIRIINHIRNATSPHRSYERMKRCVIILLSSCITQGIGWLFGPFISFINPTAGNVLGWFFIIFNGLEGLWSIVLYIIIRSKDLDKPIRIKAAEELIKLKDLPSDKYKISSTEDFNEEINDERQETNVEYRNTEGEPSHLFDHLRDVRSISFPANDSLIM